MLQSTVFSLFLSYIQYFDKSEALSMGYWLRFVVQCMLNLALEFDSSSVFYFFLEPCFKVRVRKAMPVRWIVNQSTIRKDTLPQHAYHTAMRCSNALNFHDINCNCILVHKVAFAKRSKGTLRFSKKAVTCCLMLNFFKQGSSEDRLLLTLVGPGAMYCSLWKNTDVRVL